MPGIKAGLSNSDSNMLRSETDQGREETDLTLCLLCLEVPSSPTLLDCGHTFCFQCIEDYMDDYVLNESSIGNAEWTCSTCLKPSTDNTSTTDDRSSEDNRIRNDTKSLNPSLNSQPCDVCSFSSKSSETEVHCSKCLLNLCSDCKDVHANHALFKLHPVVHIANKDSVAIYCEDHNNTQSHYFCDDCQKPCCSVCVLRDHNNHRSCTLLDALNQRRDKIKSQLNIICPQLTKIESKIKTLKQISERRIHASSSYIRSISEPATDLTQSLDSQSDISDNEASQLLPRVQFYQENEKLLKGSPHRKRPSMDHEKALSPLPGPARRKHSFFDNFRVKKMSDPHVGKTLLGGGNETLATNYIGMYQEGSSPVEPKTPSPFFKRRLSRQSSSISKKSPTTSMTTPWHQFTRMGKTSPVLQKKFARMGKTSPVMQKRKLAATASNPERDKIIPVQMSQETHDVIRLMVFDKQVPVDNAKLGKYQHKLQLLRKLCTHASKTFSAKRFLDSYDELELRLISATDVELKQLKARVQDMMDQHEAALQTMSMTPSNSLGSMDMIGTMPRTRYSPASPVDGLTDVRNSELTLLIKPQLVWKTEKHSGEIWNRCGIAFLPNGGTVVAEYDMNNMKNNRLHIYDQAGETVKVICEQQMCPLGLAVTAEGHIAVTDCKSKRVKIVTENGQPVCEWGKGHFGWPHGIAVNSKGQFIVSDAFNDFISIHHPDGKKIRQIGSSGTGNSCFRNPFHIAIDRDDNIIVSDCGNNCIKVFNTEGEFLFSNRGVSSTSLEGFDGNKNRRLKGPRGVTVDPKGNILVADDSSRVVMFDSKGRYIRNVLTEEEHVKLSGEEHVKFVEGMAMNREGVLALTECNPSQMFSVKVFKVYELS